MPDIFAHCLVGVIVPLTWNTRRCRDYLLAILLSTFPDIDSFSPWHRAAFHSLNTDPLTVVLNVMLHKSGYSVNKRVLLSILPLIHVLMDLVTGGMPVKLLFPLLDYSY